jgi:hypothetical protein
VNGNGHATITRADIEEKLRAIRDSMAPVAEGAKTGAMAVVPVVVVVLVLTAYLVGRRKGNKRRAVIEIRRV